MCSLERCWQLVAIPFANYYVTRFPKAQMTGQICVTANGRDLRFSCFLRWHGIEDTHDRFSWMRRAQRHTSLNHLD